MWAKYKDNSNKTDSMSGFTIVELLIVIVIIAVLAAITVIAYNGIQDRAVNTQRITAAKDYQKIINSYMVSRGAYPAAVGATATYCLGDGYPDWNADGTAADCFATNNVKFVSAALNTELLKEVSSLPNFPKTPVQTGGTQSLGLGYRGITLDTQTGRVGLFYWLKGANQSCGLNNVLTLVTGNEYASSSALYTSSGSDYTNCVIGIPDPSKL